MSIRVVNKRTYKPKEGERAIYIGRPSPLGNPFVMESQTNSERERVIKAYRQWLYQQISDSQEVKDELNNVLEAAFHFDVALVCWCAPKACHGDVIKEVIDKRLNDLTPTNPIPWRF